MVIHDPHFQTFLFWGSYTNFPKKSTMTIQLISGPLTCGSMRLKSTDCKAPRQNTEVLPVTTAGSHSKPCNLKKGMNNKFSDAEKIDYSLQNLVRKI